MSQQKRKEREKLASRKINLLLLLAVFIFLFSAFTLYRREQKIILKTETYKVSEHTTLHFFKDLEFMEVEGFQGKELAVSPGTKVSSYQKLVKTDLMISKSYVDEQIAVIDKLLKGHYYEDWTKLRSDMLTTLGKIETITSQNKEETNFLVNAARYCGLTKGQLEDKKADLKTIKTGEHVPITLDNMGNMMAGYVFPSATEYQRLNVEEILSILDHELLGKLDSVHGEDEPGIKVISNDHMFAVCELPKGVYVQGQDEAIKLKEDNLERTSEEDYYTFLTKRVDLLRQYPEISFNSGKKEYSAYLVNIIESESEKMLILLMKDHIRDFLSLNRAAAELHVIQYNAWVVPESSIMHSDGHTYISVIDRDYFDIPVEVIVSNYHEGKAALRYSENSLLTGSGYLSDGDSIRVYPGKYEHTE